MTPDCGAEFSLYQDVSNALSNVPFYFADPHSPRQRGTNENTNGLLREFLPKGSDFALVLLDTIDHFIFLLNLCPRKCLACRSRLRYFSRRCCT
ncbi:IS30 family transposase [Lawsonibacter asaccharolyticus]|uniref:IS30 family transposase n=1 Tax=Lawsonibacter asaccharolyticus TaxID=2108523 RepID=UPI003D3210D3